MKTSRQRGSVTIVAAAVCALLVALVLAGADLARVISASARAQTAADASSLAAAQELALPSGHSPAEVARVYAELNGALLVACTCPPGALEAVVTVEADVSGLLVLRSAGPVRASARAVVDAPQ